MYYSIRIISTYTRLGPNGVYRQATTPCRSAGDLYQALMGSNEQALTDHRATCTQLLMSLTACEDYKPLGICLNFSMSALPKTSKRNSGNRTATACWSASNITVHHFLVLSVCSWSLCTCKIVRAWLQQVISFLLYTPLRVLYLIDMH